jgi:hypothetical protein
VRSDRCLGLQWAGAFLLVLDIDLLFFMLFDLMIMLEARNLLAVVIVRGALLKTLAVGLEPPRAPKCHRFDSFPVFGGHLIL